MLNYLCEARSKGFVTLRKVTLFFDEIGHAKSVGFSSPFFDEVRAELVRNISRLVRFLCYLRKKEFFPARPGFEPTHLRDLSEQIYVAGLADCATATQGKAMCEK